MWLGIWLVLGFITVIATLLYSARDGAITVLEGIFIVLLSILLSIWGPITTIVVGYWLWQGWRIKFPVDDDDRIIYPWRE